MNLTTKEFEHSLEAVMPFGLRGRVTAVSAHRITAVGLPVAIGAEVQIDGGSGRVVEGEVIGIKEGQVTIMPYAEVDGICAGNTVTYLRSRAKFWIGPRILGRVLDARGAVIDGRGPLARTRPLILNGHRTPSLERPRITEVFGTGVRVLDGTLTIGIGQRLGIFAGSGVGKSTLLGQLVRGSEADVAVVVLVGERGREVREFVERDLGPDGLAKSVLVVATGDQPACLRIRSALAGTAVAEYFRDQGKNVLLVMDSVTRFAMAQREIGLSAGEPPTIRGYPPSVFAMLPKLLERSGTSPQGAITALYTVLVEGDDTNEPISDAIRGILDGHLHLSRNLAEQSHWPAVDVLKSISRCMSGIVDAQHRHAADSLRRILAAHQRMEDLINIGAYRNGSDADVDRSILHRAEILQFLQQSVEESVPFAETRQRLAALASKLQSQSMQEVPAPQ